MGPKLKTQYGSVSIYCQMTNSKLPRRHAKSKPLFAESTLLPEDLPDDDLDTIVTGSPGDLVVVTHRDDFTTKDLASDLAAGKVTLRGSTDTGSGLPSGAATRNDVDGAERLVSKIAGWPGFGTGAGGCERGEELGLLGTGGGGWIGCQVKDDLALAGTIVCWDFEGHKSAGIFAVVPCMAGNRGLANIEVDGAVFGMVSRSVGGKDGLKGSISTDG